MGRELSPEDMKAFEPEAKVGLVATVSPEGLPHLTLITSIQAKSPTQIMWGQFMEGRSKQHVIENPKTAFLVMSLDRKLWRGTANWTHCAEEGEDYVYYNNLPMFRYNSYFGFHRVHYMDIVDCGGKEDLFLPGVVAGTLAATVSGKLATARNENGLARPERVLKPWTITHLSSPTTLKFLAYVTETGYPTIIPLVAAHPAGPRELLFGPFSHRNELASVPDGAQVALYAMNLEMESVLLRGAFAAPALTRARATMDIHWVYNSAPPTPGQIYPQVPLRPVTEFE